MSGPDTTDPTPDRLGGTPAAQVTLPVLRRLRVKSTHRWFANFRGLYRFSTPAGDTG